MTDLATPIDGLALLREILADCHTPDTVEIIDHVIARVCTLEEAHALLRLMLPSHLTSRLGRSSTLAPNGSGGISVYAESRTPLVTPNPTRTINPPRLESAVHIYKRILAIRETAADGSKRFMRDMTAPDLLHAAMIRGKLSRANAEAEKRYLRLADELERSGHETVADLPGEVVIEVMTR